MFELKDHIEKWRRELILNQSMSRVNADELEAHLNESIEELTSRGLSEEESYWIARHRLGETRALILEYSKVDPAIIWRKRLLWLLFGYFLFATVPSLVNMFALPIHLLDIKWLLFQNHLLFGDRFTFPIPLYILVLILIGGIFFTFTSRRKVFKRKGSHPSDSASRSEISYKSIVVLLGMVLTINIGAFLLNLIVARVTGPATMGMIDVSARVFASLWQVFLFLSMIVIGFMVYWRRSERSSE